MGDDRGRGDLVGWTERTGVYLWFMDEGVEVGPKVGVGNEESVAGFAIGVILHLVDPEGILISRPAATPLTLGMISTIMLHTRLVRTPVQPAVPARVMLG